MGAAFPVISFHTVHSGAVMLHTAAAGLKTGMPVVLLHGFPEFWYGWRRQIPALAAQGFRVIAPDQRGYNLSEKPRGVAAYNIDHLADDVIGLAGALGIDRFCLAGHDFGAAVAWWVAMRYPDRLNRLAILNVPHPWVMARHLRSSARQRLKSWYMAYFQLPGLPEVSLRGRGYRNLFDTMVRSARPGTFDPEDYHAYREAWAQPGALTAMINWYRALMRARPARITGPRRVTVPTLVIWGRRDDFLNAEMAQLSADRCEDGRLVMIDQATHWVQHEEAERVNQLLAEFFG